MRHLAALAVVAIVTAGACGTDQDPALDVPDDRSTVSSTTTTTTAAAPTTIPATERPERWVGINDDGRLVVVATATGEVERVLGEFDHPTECPEGDEPVAGCQWVVEAAVTADGEQVYFETCCEPAPGVVYRVPIDGGEAVQITYGGYPAVDPAGERLAVVELQWVTVVPLTGGEQRSFRDDDGEVASFLQGMSWSPDGSTLAFSVHDEDGERMRLHLLDVATATSFDDARPVPQPPGASWTLPQYRADGKLIVAGQEPNLTGPPIPGPAAGLVVDPRTGSVEEEFDYGGRVASQHVDASGVHLLYTLEDGSVHWRSSGGETAALAPSGYVAAAW